MIHQKTTHQLLEKCARCGEARGTHAILAKHECAGFLSQARVRYVMTMTGEKYNAVRRRLCELAPSAGLYDDHPDVGKVVETLTPVTFGENGKGHVLPKGSRGVVVLVEPAASTLVWIVQVDGLRDDDGNNYRGLDRGQFRVLA